MRKLSKYEKETIINWNEGETIASIYTFNASLKRRLEDFQSEISSAVPLRTQYAGRQRDLCTGQIPTFNSAGAAVQRRTAGSCKGVQRAANPLCRVAGAAAHCWGQGATPIGRLRAAAIIGSRVKRLAQGKLMPASTCTGDYLTQKLTGLAASPLRPFGKRNKDWEG